MEEITATFLRERHRWDDTVIAECDPESPADCEASLEPAVQPANTILGKLAPASPRILVKTTAAPGDFQAKLAYRFYGHWVTHEKYGRQFHAQTFVKAVAHGERGTIAYLMQAPGIGRQLAKSLWGKFQSEAVRMVRESPLEAAEALHPRFSVDAALAASGYLKSQNALENATIDVVDLLAGRGFPRDTPRIAIGKWGNRAANTLRRNPYLLMKQHGCGFLGCDRLFLDCGGNLKRLKRQALAAWYTADRDTNGHAWFLAETIAASIKTFIGGTAADPVRALRLARRSGLLRIHRPPQGRTWVAEASVADDEDAIATWIRERWADGKHQMPHAWPVIGLLPDLTGHQRAGLSAALQSQVGVFTGSAGTGKTFSVARLIGVLCAHYGEGSIACAAPTGKAAVRLTEVMQSYGVPIQATTIHRLLGVVTRGKGWEFLYNANNPLPFGFVFIDEASMNDTWLTARLLEACDRDTHVLFVGDTNQLPPVGRGAPLRDMIAGGVPTGTLSEIQRNAGTIVRTCTAIRDDQPWMTDERIAIEGGCNLGLIEATAATAIDRILATIDGLAEQGAADPIDPIWDCQVIVPLNVNSPLRRCVVNQRLQAALNPHGGQAEGSPFRVGDKIICLRNGMVPEGEGGGQVFVANGEIGRVLGVFSSTTVAKFDGPSRVVSIPRAASKAKDGTNGDDGDSPAGCDFDLAYAVSCHKYQGSEVPIAFVVIDEFSSARTVCSREWLYTAISRAKKLCFLVGKKAVAERFCRHQAIAARKTFLAEKIAGL